MRIETLAVHAGHAPDPATGAVTPPIHLSTTFEREADGHYRAGLVYSRYANPNRVALEECLAALEGGAGAASGRGTGPVKKAGPKAKATEGRVEGTTGAKKGAKGPKAGKK